MSLIDSTYFFGNVSLPNMTDARRIDVVNYFIGIYEPMFLLKLFGYPLYKAYTAANADPRFVSIISGVEFTDINGNLAKWNGLVRTNPIKQSIIANYVWYWMKRYTSTQTSEVGEFIPIPAEGTQVVSPRKKMASVWNEMKNEVLVLLEYLDLNPTIYPEFTTYNKNEALKYFDFMNPIF